MPTITVTLPDITQSVYRPVMVDVAYQVKEWTKINNLPVYFPNDEGLLTTAGTGLDNKTDRLTRSHAERRLEITASEIYAEDQQVTDITGKAANTRVFEDRPLNIWMAPGYTSSEVTMTFAFKTNSKEEARRWRDDITARYLQGRYSLQHQITYCYNLPNQAWELIDQLYSKREAVAGYGQSLEEWLSKCMTNRVALISNEAGTRKTLAVSERQDRIQGFFSFTNEPEKIERDADSGLYIANFNYKFVYQRPATLDMHYPVIVHQQLLDKPFIEFVNRGIRHDDRVVHRSQYLWGLKPFESMELMAYLKPKNPFIRIPYVDDFSYRYGFPGTAPYLTILTQQSGEDDTLLANLKHLGDIVMDPDVLDFLKTEYKYITAPGKSIFHFDTFKGDTLLNFPSVRLDENMNLICSTKIDMRKPYRIRCALFTDLSFIDRSALDRLMNHPKAFTKVFGAINQLLFLDTTYQSLNDQRRIYPWQLSRLYEVIMGQGTCNIYTGPGQSYGLGAWGTNDLNQQKTFMTDIPESVIRAYRTARRGKLTVQLLGIATYAKDRDLETAKYLNIA